jgi:hypothetical protein
MCPRAGLVAVEKRKISCPCRESKPGRPSPQPVAIATELFRLQKLQRYKDLNIGPIFPTIDRSLHTPYSHSQYSYGASKVKTLDTVELRLSES